MSQPASESIKDRILSAVQTAMRQINSSTGTYWNTIQSANVQLGDVNGLEILSYPFIEILGRDTIYNDEAMKDRVLRFDTGRFQIDITGFLETRTDARTAVSHLTRDIHAAINADRQLGGLVLDMLPVRDSPWYAGPTENEQASCGVEWTFVAWFRTRIDNLEMNT